MALVNLPVIEDRAARFEQLDQIVQGGWKAILHTGRALEEIRDEELFKEVGFETFEGYCDSRGFSLPRGHQMIDAAKVVSTIVERDGLPPRTEGQIRALGRLVKEPELLVEAWKISNEKAEEPGHPKGREVREAVRAVLLENPEAETRRKAALTSDQLPWLSDRFDKLIYELDWWRARAGQGTDHGYWDRIKVYVNR